MNPRPQLFPARASACALILVWTAYAVGADLPQPARTFINSRCTECHDADTSKGGLDLTALSPQLDDPKLEAKWTYVFDRVQRGEMPPKKEPPPNERDVFLKSLGGFLSEHDAARQARDGRVVLRRLNRVEYENTIHDLLRIGTPLRDMLPADTAAFGFDNVSEALRLSSSQIEAYLQAADKALDAALQFGADPRKKKHFNLLELPNIRDALDKPHGSLNSDGTKYQQIYGALPDAFLMFVNDTFGGTILRDSFTHYAGNYKIRISVSAHQNNDHPVVVGRLHITTFLLERVAGAFDFAPGQTREAEVTAWFGENEGVVLRAAGCDQVAPDGTKLNDVGAENYKGPGLAVHWIEVEGPLVESWPPPSVKCVFGDVPVRPLDKPQGGRTFELAPSNPPEEAAKEVAAFASRAFRRPVKGDDTAPYILLATEALKRGESFENAVRGGCKAILASPEFLFLHEERGRLDDYALAARLSYFLWSTMPDDELLNLAAQGKLKDPATLRSETERMLNSPKSLAFVKNYCGQAFGLRNIDATQPERELYPEFDGLLKEAMVAETEAFFGEMLRADLGAATLIDSDFAMLNRRLAEHYGIPGVTGEHMRKVMLPPGSHRGGLMTQAGILKVTANGSLSSPVVRGTWVMKRLLGFQPQPPPADAGSIEPDTRGTTTIREQLEKHRRMASCAACHQYMDPPGFALENYDVIGGWREWYRSQGKGQVVAVTDPTSGAKMRLRQGPPVDASGVLADGRKFANIEDIKKLLLTRQEAVARNLANNLFTYATGAGITFADRGEVQTILEHAQPHAYGLRTLIHEIVQSRLFQNK